MVAVEHIVGTGYESVIVRLELKTGLASGWIGNLGQNSITDGGGVGSLVIRRTDRAEPPVVVAPVIGHSRQIRRHGGYVVVAETEFFAHCGVKMPHLYIVQGQALICRTAVIKIDALELDIRRRPEDDRVQLTPSDILHHGILSAIRAIRHPAPGRRYRSLSVQIMLA